MDGCILWGARVVIPLADRSSVLRQLYESHPGICKMKNVAQAYLWWPGLDAEIITIVQTCEAFQLDRPNPSKALLHLLECPTCPWARVHIDHAGPFHGKLFLVVVDAYSKWIDVHMVPSTYSEATIAKLRAIFSNFGLPEQLVQTTQRVLQVLNSYGIKQVLTAPYHPASNGMAEWAIQTFKHTVNKLEGPM